MVVRVIALLLLPLLCSCDVSENQERYAIDPDGQDTVTFNRSKNIVLITVDTLRADHLGCYGYHLDTTPSIDDFSKNAILYENVRATCSATAPSVATILTGLHRGAHGVARNGSVLPSVVVSIAAKFRDAGFSTRGIIANPSLGPDLGFGQGFDEFGFPPALDTGGPGRFGGAPVATSAIESLNRWASSGERFFLWLHFMDPHGAYFPPDEFESMFSEDDYGPAATDSISLVDANYGFGVLPRYQRLSGQVPGDMVAVNDLKARYDSEIRYVDSQIGRVLDSMRDLRLLDETAVVITADHGEGLGEHNYYFQHGWFLYDDCLKVPLLIRTAKNKKGRRVESPVSLLDLAPTVLEAAGLTIPETYEGASLFTLTKNADGRPAFSQTYYGNQLTSLTERGFKLIFTPPPPDPDHDNRKRDGWFEMWPKTSRFELYDLNSDPHEETDLARLNSDRFEEMRISLVSWLAEQQEWHSILLDVLRNDEHYNKQVRMLERDVRIEEQLRALGYAN
jgi:arylsulfatase